MSGEARQRSGVFRVTRGGITDLIEGAAMISRRDAGTDSPIAIGALLSGAVAYVAVYSAGPENARQNVELMEESIRSAVNQMLAAERERAERTHANSGRA